ncbi:flagellar hook-length control protein FliK [uncultured Desulfobulbus sp.]|uniref:flagellar hook-length control protein FliK n=1 Tax=uncultured Desulfobulbus sp. TaxID=239745 RepID=UPI0029C7F697|nr:flagellar hook-length control protein FliK [uncultured Desulfobulbus sp.]
MQALSSVPVDVMPAAPPVAASSANTGQKGHFASNLKTATEKQTTAERPSKTADKQSGSSPTTDKLSSVPKEADSSEETGEEASLEATPNGSAGAALQQFATSQKSDEGVNELKGGSDSSLSLVQSNKSAVDKLLESLTKPMTPEPLTTTKASGSTQDESVAESTQQETAAQLSQPFDIIAEEQKLATAPPAARPDTQVSAVTSDANSSRQAGASTPQPQITVSFTAGTAQAPDLAAQQSAGASTSPTKSTEAAAQEDGAQQNGPLIVQNKYGQILTIHQAGETAEETAIASSSGKTVSPGTEGQRMDVNNNYIHSHLPNDASPETTKEGDDQPQDPSTQSKQQEATAPKELAKKGLVTGEQSIIQKGQPNLVPENQPLIFAHERSSGQITTSSTTVESSTFRLPSGSTVPEGVVVDQMITHFSMNKRLETGTVNLKLYPQELGELRMEIKVEQDNIKAHIIAQNPQAQEMIDRHLPRLREALAQQGLHLQQVEVTLAAQDNTGGERFKESDAWRQPSPSLHRTSSDQPVFTLEADESTGEDHSIANTLSVHA